MSITGNRFSPANRQRGAVLMLLLLLVSVGALAVFVSGLNRATVQLERDRVTAAALAQAKEALIGYAATFPETHLVSGQRIYVFGHLPCPDMGTGIEGVEASSCGGSGNQDKSVIGRLPWKTLGLPPLRDGYGECLWYAVSGIFKANTKTNLMNWDTIGQFEVAAPDGLALVAGNSPTTRPVAVIFSSGPILSDNNQIQARPPVSGAGECGGNYVPANYLDVPSKDPNQSKYTDTSRSNYMANYFIDNTVNGAIDVAANMVKRFITPGLPNSDMVRVSVNDRMAFVSRDEIFQNRIEKRTDFPGNYFNETTLSSATLNDFNDLKNKWKDGTSSSPAVYGLLQKTAQCLVKYGRSNSSAADKRLPWAAPLVLPDFSNDTFNDAVGTLVGRPPFIVRDSAITTPTNLLVTSSNSYRLLTVSRCPDGWINVAGEGGTLSKDGWWDKWKDHLFYAVADAFKPSSTIASATLPCSEPGAKCLTVNGNGPYAAVLIFAGKKVGVQQRNTISDKTDTNNYLEGINAIALVTNDPSDLNYGKYSVTAGNDAMVCINQDLTIDASCSATTCLSNAAKLISYVSGQTNNCKSGASVLPACTVAANNLTTCSCSADAQAFITLPCINNLNPAACQSAISHLQACSS